MSGDGPAITFTEFNINMPSQPGQIIAGIEIALDDLYGFFYARNPRPLAAHEERYVNTKLQEFVDQVPTDEPSPSGHQNGPAAKRSQYFRRDCHNLETLLLYHNYNSQIYTH